MLITSRPDGHKLFLFIALLFICSCGARKSMFSDNSIQKGISKTDFIGKYGKPFSSSLEENGMEILEYKEVVDVREYTYVLSSKFYFKNSELVKMKQEENEPPCADQIRLRN